MSSIADMSAIEAEIGRIRSLGVAALRARWRSLFGAPPPDGLTKDLIGRMIAYRIQEEAFGGLDRQTLKLMDRLARGGKPGSESIRRLKAGTVLVREHDGKRHAVTVVPGGFAWNGTIYPSLSSIARAITGTAWNGPRFFGLRTKANEREKNDPVQRGPADQTPLRAPVAPMNLRAS
jgi:hypothetical protein